MVHWWCNNNGTRLYYVLSVIYYYCEHVNHTFAIDSPSRGLRSKIWRSNLKIWDPTSRFETQDLGFGPVSDPFLEVRKYFRHDINTTWYGSSWFTLDYPYHCVYKWRQREKRVSRWSKSGPSDRPKMGTDPIQYKIDTPKWSTFGPLFRRVLLPRAITWYVLIRISLRRRDNTYTHV